MATSVTINLHTAEARAQFKAAAAAAGMSMSAFGYPALIGLITPPVEGELVAVAPQPLRSALTGTVVNPAPSPTDGLLGMYPGVAGSDTGVTAALGVTPQIGSSYYQIGNIANIATVEKKRVESGIVSHIAVAPRDSATYPTGALTYMKGLVDGTATALDFFGRFFGYCNTVGGLNAVPVTLFPLVEPEVQFHSAAPTEGNLASLYAACGNNTTATFTAVGEYHEAFYQLAATEAPNCETGLWVGGFSGQYTNLNTMMAAIDTAPGFVGTDPYNNTNEAAESSSSTWETPAQTWASRVNAFRSSSGAHHAHYTRWGSPPVILTETGIAHHSGGSGATKYHSDAQLAAWIGQLRATMTDMDIARVVYFNSAGPNGNQAITGGSYPLACAAMAAQINA